MDIQCPKCASRDVRVSRPRMLDYVYRAFSLSPYRCRSCQKRFYASGREQQPHKPVASR
jgi:hypothetical protein